MSCSFDGGCSRNQSRSSFSSSPRRLWLLPRPCRRCRGQYETWRPSRFGAISKPGCGSWSRAMPTAVVARPRSITALRSGAVRSRGWRGARLPGPVLLDGLADARVPIGAGSGRHRTRDCRGSRRSAGLACADRLSIDHRHGGGRTARARRVRRRLSPGAWRRDARQAVRPGGERSCSGPIGCAAGTMGTPHVEAADAADLAGSAVAGSRRGCASDAGVP